MFPPAGGIGVRGFPCKWHFDIKMRCLRNQERTQYGVVFCQEPMPLKSPIMGFPFGWNCAIFPTNKDLVELCVCGDHAGTVDDDGFESLRNRKERIQRGHITEVPLHDFHLLFRFYDHLQFWWFIRRVSVNRYSVASWKRHVHGKGGSRVKLSLLAFLVNHSARNCGNSDYGNYNRYHPLSLLSDFVLLV